MNTSTTARTVSLSLLGDVVCVVLFAIAGRASHHEAVDAAGIWETVWPFLAGLALGWLVTAAWRRPTGIGRALVIWPVTVAAGMILRVVTGQGTALAFVLVALGVVGLLLVGWRVIVHLVTKRGRGSASAPSGR